MKRPLACLSPAPSRDARRYGLNILHARRDEPTGLFGTLGSEYEGFDPDVLPDGETMVTTARGGGIGVWTRTCADR